MLVAAILLIAGKLSSGFKAMGKQRITR